MTTQTQTITAKEGKTPLELDLDFPGLPSFPTNLPTAPLKRISLQNLRNDPTESQLLYSCSRNLGFFYLDLRGDPEGETLLEEANKFFDLGPKFYDLGREELQKYDYKSQGSYMGYKGYGAAVVDEKGNLDANEFYNIPKVDFLGIAKKPFAHPQILYDNKTLIKSYMHHCHSLVLYILDRLNEHLHLPPGTLTSLHRLMEESGDQIRLIKSPPQPESEARIALGKHTDFGSITILFNQLGGLQILPPPSIGGDDPQWTYVRPLKGHCIVNLGDAMVKFTNGLLRSNIHRVVAPPGEQASHTRYSVVYFARPEDNIILKRLEGSDIIPELQLADGEAEEAMNSKDWILLQAMRLRNIKPNMSDTERQNLWEQSGRGK